MRFAYSPHRGAINEPLFAWIKHRLDAGDQVYALIDGSIFNPSMLRSLTGVSGLQPALAGSPFENYGLQGPLLWSVQTADSPGLRTLLPWTDGTPALSFIATRHDMAILNERLVWLAAFKTEDGQKLHCRFADSRVLPTLLDCLTPAQNAVLAEVIGEWAWIARDTTLQTKAFATTASAPMPPTPFELDAAQFAFMMTRAEPDMVFQMLTEQMPELLPEVPGHQMHLRLANMLEAAHRHDISDLPDLFQYAVVALTTRDDFDRHPALADSWLRLRKEGIRLSELIEQWTDDIWQAIQSAPEANAAVHR